MPLVTIITPTYNQGQFIEATIKSVLAQTYQNIEYIVIDALSTDATASILEQYQSQISRVIREKDAGQSDAIVKGFKLAKGELVGWINSDDLLYPDCVEKIVAAYRAKPDTVLLYNSQIDIILEDGSFSRKVDIPAVSHQRLLRENVELIQPGSFYKNEALVKVGYFNKSLRFSMDLDLWLRLLTVGPCIDINAAPIAGYREWGGTKTSTGDSKLLKERKNLLISHGAQIYDKAVVAINVSLIKCFVKNVPLVGRFRKMLNGVSRSLRLSFYYGLLAHLPASTVWYGAWCRSARRIVCSGLFHTAGTNINVEKGAFFGTGKKIRIGSNSGIGVDCKLFGEVTIGENVMMGPEVVFLTTTHDHSRIDVPMIEQGFSQEKPIFISDDVWIGTRCTFLPGVKIGKGVIVGASSVVTKNFPDYVTIAGNPARVVKHRAEAKNITSNYEKTAPC